MYLIIFIFMQHEDECEPTDMNMNINKNMYRNMLMKKYIAYIPLHLFTGIKPWGVGGGGKRWEL
jgi:hypothetical protein